MLGDGAAKESVSDAAACGEGRWRVMLGDGAVKKSADDAGGG